MMAVNAAASTVSSSPSASAEPEIANALEVRNVTVSYRSYRERPTSLKESIIRLVKKGKFAEHEYFQALSDISFDIRKGEILGIIGSNGCGKSTLLKVLAGVLRPTAGSVARMGTIASLIELGAGFDPELNAVENIYLHASLHRKSRAQIRTRVQHILEFAELTEFANTPVKYYSSGMYARLGFAVAVDIDPDILLVDEILSVGDERFQQKSSEVFHRFFDSGKTIVIVSHDLGLISKVASRTVVLSKGRVFFDGETQQALAKYHDPSYRQALAGTSHG